MSDDVRDRIVKVLCDNLPMSVDTYLGMAVADVLIRELPELSSKRSQCHPVYEVGGAFQAHDPRNCGEHRTVGERSWCHDCREWCYPDEGCVGCRYPDGVD